MSRVAFRVTAIAAVAGDGCRTVGTGCVTAVAAVTGNIAAVTTIAAVTGGDGHTQPVTEDVRAVAATSAVAAVAHVS